MTGLRIIAGVARGRRLRSVPGDSTRPITDRAKESLFNIISSDVIGATFLDLFAGTGSVGLEALSRGAIFVRFIDNKRQAVDTIRFNLSTTGLQEGAEVLRMDTFSSLKKSGDRNFDYIFIAPPQYKGMWKQTLSLLDSNISWMAESAWVIVQIHPKEYEDLALDNLHQFDKREYGSVMFLFYERKRL